MAAVSAATAATSAAASSICDCRSPSVATRASTSDVVSVDRRLTVDQLDGTVGVGQAERAFLVDGPARGRLQQRQVRVLDGHGRVLAELERGAEGGGEGQRIAVELVAAEVGVAAGVADDLTATHEERGRDALGHGFAGQRGQRPLHALRRDLGVGILRERHARQRTKKQ